MSLMVLVIGFVVAVGVALVGWHGWKGTPSGVSRGLSAVLGLAILFGAFTLASVRFISADEVGIVVKNALGPRLPQDRIVAVNGEMGIQAEVLEPGIHLWYWPVIYDVRDVPLVEISNNEVGIITARDGRPLPQGQLFAPEWPRTGGEFEKMLDARHFLGAGQGYKGQQASVLTPGKYRINTELFQVSKGQQVEVAQGEVGVLKANYGGPPSERIVIKSPSPGPGMQGEEHTIMLALEGEMGVRAAALPPGKYPLNPNAYTVVEIWTTQMVSQYTAIHSTIAGKNVDLGEREIRVTTSDGFQFPVDVRVEYVVDAANAPRVVAALKDDEGDHFRSVMDSAVRAIFRNNAEKVRALDYVQQRSAQESQSMAMLVQAMAPYGIRVTAVRIGNVGDEQTLGALLKTQTDREIAKQEQQTFQEQQKAAAQKKELSRSQQEAEEEKRLATAAYQVKIAEQDKLKQVIAANAEAESIRIKAEAQARAYEAIAKQIGQGNAATIELLKIVGERNINITPRVLVGGMGSGGVNGALDGQTAALLGTMLEGMVSREEEERSAGGKK